MQWHEVTVVEFESFLQTYPRPLEAQPPIYRKAIYRKWLDSSLGEWPDNVVAKRWLRGQCHGFQVRTNPEIT
jgi:hypothetical protein